MTHKTRGPQHDHSTGVMNLYASVSVIATPLRASPLKVSDPRGIFLFEYNFCLNVRLKFQLDGLPILSDETGRREKTILISDIPRNL